MHEMSIAMALIEQMEQVAREQKARSLPAESTWKR